MANHIPIELIIVGEQGTLGVPLNVKWIEQRPALKGLCVRKGILASHGEVVLVADADLPVTDEQLELFLESIAWNDVVFGNRWIPGTKMVQYKSKTRAIASRVFGTIVRLIFGLTTVDTQCGLKAFRREAAKQIFMGQTINGLAADVEVVVCAYMLGFNPVNLHVDWRDEGKSTIRVWRSGLVMFMTVIWLRVVFWFRGEMVPKSNQSNITSN